MILCMAVPRSQDGKAKGSQVWGNPWLYSDFKLTYTDIDHVGEWGGDYSIYRNVEVDNTLLTSQKQKNKHYISF